MIIIKDSNVTIMVQDIEKSIHFYQKLGLTLKDRWQNNYAMVTTSGITIGLHPANEAEFNESSVSIGFFVDDIAEATNLLEDNHIYYKMDDSKSGIYLYFNDPDGTVLYFVEHRRQ